MNEIVKSRMNKDEIHYWLNNASRYFQHLIGNHKFGKWYIRISNKFGKIRIYVSGYNGITFGEIRIDNGFLGEQTYYPILKFHNQLSFSLYGSGSYVTSDTLTVSYKPKNEIITLEMLVSLIEESWNKIKLFLNQ